MVCAKEGHNNQEFIQICFHPNCNRSKCCQKCITTDHKDHDMFLIPFQLLQSEFKNRNKDNVFYGKCIEKDLTKIKDKLCRFISLIDNEIQRLNKMEFQELALTNYVLVNYSSDTPLEEYISDISQVACMSEKNLKVSSDIAVQMLHEKTQRGLRRISNPIYIQMKQISNGQYVRRLKCEFSEEMKHSSIQIIDGDTAKKTGSSYSIVFGEDSFEPQSESFRFALKIVNKASNIWLGVGANTNSNYLFSDYNNLGHHKYMIAYHRYAFHHSNRQVNHTTPSFSFDTGATINIAYEASNHTLTFSKHESKESYAMILTEQDFSKRLYPVVWLQGTGDTVQIMDYQD